MSLDERCCKCGASVVGKRIWFSPLRGTVECHPCHLARCPTVEYLLDALAIAQWEDRLCEEEDADGAQL